MVKTFNSCRVCKCSVLLPVIDLGVQALQGQFPEADGPDPISAPMVVVRCPECGLVQTKHSVDGAEQFSNYYYRSSVSSTMRDHLKGVAEEAAAMLKTQTGARVLDIGGNDGHLLDCIPFGTGVRTLIDPSDVPLVHDGIARIRGFFPCDMLLTQKFDLIFSLACFYDVDDPVGFAAAVKKILTTDGIWVLEVADMFSVLQNVAYDYWVHEHVALYSPYTITKIAQEVGLRVVRMVPNLCNGGSMRYYLTHQTSDAYHHHKDAAEWNARIGALWAHARGLNEDSESFVRFAKNVSQSKLMLMETIKPILAKGDRIHALGASTKLNTVLQYCGLNNRMIEAASDRDPRKVGRVTPGTRIPILSEEESRAKNPALYLTVLSMFKKELVERERAAGNKTPICFALPYPEKA